MFISSHGKIWGLINIGECLEEFTHVFASFILLIGEIRGLSLKMLPVLPKLTVKEIVCSFGEKWKGGIIEV